MYVPLSSFVILFKGSVLPFLLKLVSPSFVHVITGGGLPLALQNRNFVSLSFAVVLCGV